MAEQTIDPELTDVNLTNTVDFLDVFSDYNEHVSMFAKEIGVASVFQHTDVTVDPFTDKAQLFADLTTGDLEIKNDYRGGKDEKYRPSLIKSIRNYLGIGKPDTPIVYKRVGFADDLPREVEGMTDEFLAYWIEKYRLLHPKVQQACEKLLSGGNIYFKDISESIGCLTETDFIDDDRVLPVWDVTVDRYDPPMVYNSKLHNKLSTNTQLVSLKMSKLLNAKSRSNLANIINGPNSHFLQKDSSTDSHGNNLITDFEHRTRMNKIVTELVNSLQKQYQDLWRLVDWLNTREPTSTYPFKKVTLDVEDIKISMDLLKNKLYKTKKEMTNNCVLSVDCEDIATRDARLEKEAADDKALIKRREETSGGVNQFLLSLFGD